MPAGRAKQLWALRIDPEDLLEIKARAREVRLSATDYMIRAALGTLDDPSNVDKRIDTLERRLDTLERMADLGSYD